MVGVSDIIEDPEGITGTSEVSGTEGTETSFRDSHTTGIEISSAKEKRGILNTNSAHTITDLFRKYIENAPPILSPLSVKSNGCYLQ